MSDFYIYLQLGFDHITDLNGYDHILFVVALCAIYRFKDWRQVLVLVTAFTLGHSITLALATLKVIEYSTDLIEFLIPITILATAVLNFFQKNTEGLFQKEQNSKARYPMAMVFGLIHGMGFSNYLRSLLGREESILTPLFAFNVGLEIGQIIIVLLVLSLAFLFIDILRVRKHDWTLVVSGMVAGVALTLIKEKWIFE
ncbi:MAG: HupE/UreJ family protein [Spirosomataceae bacterium]